MTTIVLGDPGSTFTGSFGIGDFPEAFGYTAASDATITDLEASLHNSTSFDIVMGIYADSGGAPGALLQAVTVTGHASIPSGFALVTISGFSVAITSGTTYWLALWMSHGGSIEYIHGTGAPEADADFSTSGLDDPYGTSTPTENAAVAIRALGNVALPPAPPQRSKGLEFHVTGLWYPGADSVAYYGRIADHADGQVVQLRNDSSTADVTISVFDPIVQYLMGKPYSRCLRVYADDELVFWGPAVLLAGGMKDGTLRISAIDPTIRLIHHQLVRGDLDGAPQQMTHATNDKGLVTVDYVGLRILRDAALNSAAQTARGVPDLGIIDGDNSNTASPDSRMQVGRTDQVFNAMTQLGATVSADASGPDFRFKAIEDTVGAYAQLDTFDQQGSDRSSAVAFHYGTGLANLEDLQFTDGSKYTTHVHVFSRDHKFAVTPANAEASAETGPYVDTDATDFDASNIDETVADEVLNAYGDQILKAYSRPLLTVDVTLPLQSQSELRVGRDFDMGDTIGVAGRSGYCHLEEAPFRIGAITRAQSGPDNDVRVTLGIEADRVAEYDDSVGDEA